MSINSVRDYFVKYVKCSMIICSILIIALCGKVNVNASELENIKSNQIVITPAGENGYNGTVIGDAVYFRSSPYLNSSNIVRLLYYGHRITGNYSGLNVAYNDGYYWSYVVNDFLSCHRTALTNCH